MKYSRPICMSSGSMVKVHGYTPPTHNYTLYFVLTEQNENKEAQGTVLIIHCKS